MKICLYKGVGLHNADLQFPGCLQAYGILSGIKSEFSIVQDDEGAI